MLICLYSADIPCDLLETRVNVHADNVVVQKMNKHEQSSSIYELFQLYDSAQKESGLRPTTLSAIIDKRKSSTIAKPTDFQQIFHKYHTGTLPDDICGSTVASGDHFDADVHAIIERHLYRASKANDSIDQSQSPAAITQTASNNEPDNSTELHQELSELEYELDRLSQWAALYSQRFQTCNDRITEKTGKLNELLNVLPCIVDE